MNRIFEILNKIKQIKHIKLITINVILIIAFIVCLIISSSIRNTLISQQAADRWAGYSNERFSQLSVFLPAGSGFDQNAILDLRNAIDDELLKISIRAEDGQSTHTDAWSTVSDVYILSRNGGMEAHATGVGGDFFLFHPLRLQDGSYFSSSDLMKDYVVLDTELAWRLFGSNNIEGLEVFINDKQHIIAGVVSREDDFASRAAYTGGPGLFMSFESLRNLPDYSDDEENGTIGADILWYEIVMPNPVTGFARAVLTKVFPVPSADIVENTTRYSLSNITGVISTFGIRSMNKDSHFYPYWENAARYTEDVLALLFIISVLLLICPVITVVIFIVKLIPVIIKHVTGLVSDVKEKYEIGIEE